MNFVALPIIFAVVESIVLSLLVHSPEINKTEKKVYDTILLFISLSILFNICLYAEEKLLLPDIVENGITVILGIGLLLVFTRLSWFVTPEAKSQSQKKSITSFSITFFLINGLILLLCIEILSSRLWSVGWLALSSAVLFLSKISGFCDSRLSFQLSSTNRLIALFYLGSIIVLILGFLFENRTALIFFSNVSLILMTTYNLKSELRIIELEDNIEKLENYNLTKRQLEVARLMMEGLTYAEIADQLSIAENTATKHGSDIFAKTSSEDRNAFYAKFYPEYLKTRTLELRSTRNTKTEKSA